MNENNKSVLFIILRPILFLLPLAFGSPFISYCLCAFNAAITIVGNRLIGAAVEVITALGAIMLCATMGLGTAYGVFFAMQIVAVSAVCALCIMTRRSFASGLLLSSTAYGLIALMQLKASAGAEGLSIADSLVSGVVTPLRESIDSVLTQNGIDAGTAEQLFSTIESSLRLSLPSMIIIYAIVSGYFVMWMVSRSFRSTPLGNGHSFGNIRVGYPAVIYAAVMGLLLLIPNESVRLISVNGLIVFVFLAFCAGLSLVDFLMRIKIKSIFARCLLHVAIIIFCSLLGSVIPIFNILLLYAAAGVVDCFVSIRKRVNTGNEIK